jgi:hypothetical protein
LRVHGAGLCWVLVVDTRLAITFVWLLCARRESPLDGQMRYSR